MMPSFDFQPTTRVVFGENALERLGELTRSLPAKRVLLVTDPGIIRAGHVTRALGSLEAAGVEAQVFHDVVENPTTRHVEAGREFAQDLGGIDGIIGLGGGSAMDCAKGINFLLTNGGRMEDYWGSGKAVKPMLPSIGVPTTAGTGSEGQSYALISQEETHRKMACGDIKARFRIVILDPLLTQSVPDEVAAVTGIDAISHALESFVSTRRNTVSQMFAREAWHLLEANFETILEERQNTTAWGQMLLGAHLAGLAIENAMLGAAHACANPLTANYGVTHGVAVGLMLPHVIRFNSAAVGGLYAELVRAAGLNDTEGESDVDMLIYRVNRLKAAARQPERLQTLNIPRADLPRLAREAAEQWTGKFNPREVGVGELLGIYEMAF